MIPQAEENRSVKSRWALEALRNGVPNRAAVEMLGCNQPQAQSRFTDLLMQASDRDNPLSGAKGMLVSGDFGSGKSHLLTHLEHLALSEGFVCSKVAISKETPLYDLGKVFKSAIDNGRMPDRSGRLIEELGLALRPHSGDYAAFFLWANDVDTNSLSPMFPASLLVHERSNDLELNSEIQSFWGGDKINISRIKGGLREIGQASSYSFHAPKQAELPAQRLRFAIELIKAAGYKGWVVLLDEIELIGSYSLLQRGRSYAELARWQGETEGGAYPGVGDRGHCDWRFRVRDDYGRQNGPRQRRAATGCSVRAYSKPRGNRHAFDCTRYPPPEPSNRRRRTGHSRENEAHLLGRLRVGRSVYGRKSRRRRLPKSNALQSPLSNQRVGFAATLSRLSAGN